MGNLSIAELEILLKARDDASKVLAQADSNVRTFAGNIEKFARPALMALTAATTALFGATAVFVRGAAEAQVSTARLETAIRATGDAFGTVRSEQVETFIASLENMSGFSRNEVKDALSILVFETGDVEEAMKRERIAVDFARGAHLDLYTASKLLGKVTDETIEVLSRYGIHVDKNTTSTELFALVQARFANQAVEQAETVEIKWAKLQHRLEDFVEDVGTKFLPVISELEDQLLSGHFDLSRLTDRIGAAFAPAQDWVATNAPKWLDAVSKMTSQIADYIVNHPGQLVDAIADALLNLGRFTGRLIEGFNAIFGVIGLRIGEVLINKIVDALNEGISKLNSTLGRVLGFSVPAVAHVNFDSNVAALEAQLSRLLAPATKYIHLLVQSAPGNLPDTGGPVITAGENLGGASLVSVAVGPTYGMAKSSSDRPATLADVYAAYTARHGVMPDYAYAQSVLAGGPMWSDVQGLGEGGVATRPTIAVIGERGVDEAVVPLDRYSVTPRGANGAGSLTVNVNVGGDVVGVDDLRQTILETVRQAAMAGGFRGVFVGTR